jgi:hypothetical protein
LVTKILPPVSRPDVFGVTPCVKKFFWSPAWLETKKIAEKYISFEIIAILSKNVFIVAAKVFLKQNSGQYSIQLENSGWEMTFPGSNRLRIL